jgi:hypothetical protein
MTKEDAVSFGKGIRSGIDWSRMEQIPTGLLRAMSANRTINNKRLPEADATKAKQIYEERMKLRGEGVPDSHLVESATGYVGKGKARMKRTQPVQKLKAQGKHTLFDVIHKGHADHLFGKSENKYDIRTWSKGSLTQWNRHGESAMAQALARDEAKGTAIRERHSRGQSTEIDTAYLLTRNDGALFGKELDRRAKYESKASGHLRADTKAYKTGKPDSQGRRPPKGYNSKVPHQYHRGITPVEPRRVHIVPGHKAQAKPPQGGGFQALRALSDHD